jgi:hypothetical protein
MGAHPRSESCDEFDPRGICKTKTHLTWKGNGDKRREAGGGESDTQASVSESCGPIMAPASAARRSRGYDMRTDVNAGTRKGEWGKK